MLAFAEGPDGVALDGTFGLFRRLVDGQILREQTFRLVEEVRQLLVDRAGRIWIAHGLVVSVAVPARSTAPPKIRRRPSADDPCLSRAAQMTRTFPLRLRRILSIRDARGGCRRLYEACRLVPMAGCGSVRRAG